MKMKSSLLIFILLAVFKFGYSQERFSNSIILHQMADTVNKYIGSERIRIYGSYFHNGYIYDLSDTTRNGSYGGMSGEFIEGHCYHFGYKIAYKSYSHLCFYFGKNSQFFSNVYCDSVSFNRAIVFYNKLKRKYKSEQILENIKNFRHFGKYLHSDTGPLICK